MTRNCSHHRWLGAVVLLLCSVLLPAGISGPQSDRNRGSRVEIKLKFDKAKFLIAEDINLTVSLTNHRSEPVEIPTPFHSDNWQPVYTVTGPGISRTFSFRSIALKDTRTEPEGIEPVLVKLAPGQTLEDQVPLQSWLHLAEPGEYTIVAKLDWKGISVQSEPVGFALVKAVPVSLSVGVDVNVARTMGEWVEWLVPSGTGRQVYTALFQRAHVGVSGYEPFSVTGLAMAGATATDMLSPWTNYNRQEELTKWRAWREGAELLALANGFSTPQRLDLGVTPRALVRPALMTSDGLLDVFALSGSGSELLLARFPAPNWSGEPDPPRIMWRTPLPKGVVAARCALGSQAAGNPKRVVVVSQDGSELVLSHLDTGEGSHPGAWASVKVPGFAMPNTEPGVRIDDQGVTHVAVVFEVDRARRELGIVDASFAAGGGIMRAPDIKLIGTLESAPKASVASYTIAAGAAIRRDWAVLEENGLVLHSQGSGRLLRPRNTLAIPLEMVCLTSASYLLSTDANGSPVFTLLD